MTINTLKGLCSEGKIKEACTYSENLLQIYKTSPSLTQAVVDLINEHKLDSYKSVKKSSSSSVTKSRHIKLSAIENYISLVSGVFYIDPTKNILTIERTEREWGCIRFPLFAPSSSEITFNGKFTDESYMQARIYTVEDKLIEESRFGDVSNYKFVSKDASLLFLEFRVNRKCSSIRDFSVSINYISPPDCCVVIPYFNDSKFIETALQSLAQQSLLPKQVIIVDDCSRADERKRLEEIVPSFSSFFDLKVISHTHNKGLAAARNTGIKASDTDLVAFLDSDDALTKNSIKLRFDQLIFDYTLFACASAGKIKPVKPDFDLSEIHSFEQTEIKNLDRIISLESISNGNCPFNCHSPLIWKYFLERCNYHSESMRKGAEDYDIWSRLLLSGFYFLSVPFVLGVYRQKKKSMVKIDNTGHLKESMRLVDNLINGAYNLSKPFIFPWRHSKLCGKSSLQIELSVLQRLIANICHSDIDNNQYFKSFYEKIPYHSSSLQTTLSNVIKTSIMRENGWELKLHPEELEKFKSVYSSIHNITKVLKGDEKFYYNTLTSHECLDTTEDNLYFDKSELVQFKDIHKGESCIIIGNGPSLNKHDFGEEIYNTIPTFAVNGFFYKTRETGFAPTYYVVEDTSVMKENIEDIILYQPRNHKFFPSIYKNLHPKDSRVSFFKMNRGYYDEKSPHYEKPRFSKDASDRLFCGRSVTIINLQLAYYMGFRDVYLIGMDFNYAIPSDASVNGAIITSNSDDINHFHPDYFGKGKTWKDPKLDSVLRAYAACKSAYEDDGRNIYNATVGGKLELFERRSLSNISL